MSSSHGTWETVSSDGELEDLRPPRLCRSNIINLSALQLKLHLRILEPQKLITFRLPWLEGTLGQAAQL